MRTVTTAASIAAVMVLVGCSGDEPTAPPTVTVTDTVTATWTAPGRTVTVTVTPAPPETPEADLTQQLTEGHARESWADKVIEVKRIGPRSLEVRTMITDPRGEDGSAAALEALAVCSAALSLLKAAGVDSPSVRVLESDGSTFVHAGIDSPECVES